MFTGIYAYKNVVCANMNICEFKRDICIYTEPAVYYNRLHPHVASYNTKSISTRIRQQLDFNV